MRPSTPARPWRSGPLLLLGVGAILAAGAVGALSATGFSDVRAGSVHAEGVDWLAGSGVTVGCREDRFCPADHVTREQMATFLHRLSGHAPGTAPSVDAATLDGATLAQLQAAIDGTRDDVADRLTGMEQQIAALRDELSTTSEALVTAERQLVAFEERFAGVTREEVVGNDTLRFTGMNVQVVSGADGTDAEPNGVGNLIVGYDRLRTGDTGAAKSGSHYLVVGDEHAYTSHGGIVAGRRSIASGAYASVLGGLGNTASGPSSTVTGGSTNTASGGGAVVSGGYLGVASGHGASISGGSGGVAGGQYSSILGGSAAEVLGQSGMWPPAP